VLFGEKTPEVRALFVMGVALAYFITFSTYGARLPGDGRGYADRRRNVYGTPIPEASRSRARAAQQDCNARLFVMNEGARQVVASAVREVCDRREWQLLALHVRSNHVHAVVSSNAAVSLILHDLKSYATRALRAYDYREGQRWARHGSTRFLFTQEDVDGVVRYVVEAQGRPMECFVVDGVDW
jgi:REP element-mobilizing transposase RayT